MTAGRRGVGLKGVLYIGLAASVALVIAVGVTVNASVRPRISALMSDTERVIEEFDALTQNALRLDSTLSQATAELRNGLDSEALSTLTAVGTFPPSLLSVEATRALLGTPPAMREGLAVSIDDEAVLRDALLTAQAHLELGQPNRAAEALTEAAAANLILQGSLAAAQRLLMTRSRAPGAPPRRPSPLRRRSWTGI